MGLFELMTFSLGWPSLTNS